MIEELGGYEGSPPIPNSFPQSEDAARQIFMEAAGDASSLLWRASSDNHRQDYLNPSVVIEARQRVQEAIAAAD